MTIQLPYCRVSLISTKRNGYRVSYYSRNGIQKAFLEYIKNPLVQKELINAIPLFEIYRKFIEEFDGILKSVKAMDCGKEKKLNSWKIKEKILLLALWKNLLRLRSLPFPT